jgi:[NiFe] hydrogenase assembly HybE family chaperone
MSGARECGVCWYLYDPGVGDGVWQIEPGTPFEALPEHWRCPKCDAPKDRFLVPKDATPEPAVEALVAAYDKAAQRMRDLPVFNPALRVETVGFRDFEGGLLGSVITPWFMNLDLVPGPGAAQPSAPGEKRTHLLPAGPCEFIGARLEGVGPIESCSLFSPMPQFESALEARAVAEEALALLLTPPVQESPPPPSLPSRRDLFGRLLPR